MALFEKEVEKRNRENRKLMKLQEAFEREPQELWERRIPLLRKVFCGEGEVAKLMRSMGLQGRGKGYRVTAISQSHLCYLWRKPNEDSLPLSRDSPIVRGFQFSLGYNSPQGFERQYELAQ